jgi:hypothetical protein
MSFAEQNKHILLGKISNGAEISSLIDVDVSNIFHITKTTSDTETAFDNFFKKLMNMIEFLKIKRYTP